MDALAPDGQGQDGKSRLRILIVEDDPDGGESLAMVLRLYGHEVDTACDGPAGLEAARIHPPDVVLLDLGLPRMDGCEVAKRLKQQSNGKLPFLIAVTGHGRPIDRQRSHEAGMSLHLLKPVEPDALQRVLLLLGARIGKECPTGTPGPQPQNKD